MHERLERKTKHAYELAIQYQHRLGLVSFLAGFAFDALTLHRIDRLYEQFSFGIYMSVGTVLLIWISLKERGGHEVANVAFTVLQFIFGALAGGFLVLYGRSGTLEGSIFFLSGLVLLLVGNELMRARYRRVLFRFLVWFILLIAYTTLLLPLAYGRLGLDVFQHGLLTAAIIGSALVILFRATGVLTRALDLYIGFVGMTLITALFWVSYYTHSIPPVPLSLRSALIAHSVVRVEGVVSAGGSDGAGAAGPVAITPSVGDSVYTVSYEPREWSRVWALLPFGREESSQFVTTVEDVGTRLYCFSQIYAPATLSSPLQHRWQRLVKHTDAQGVPRETHETIATIPFSITGGRQEGYRAYSYITVYPDDQDDGYGTYTCNIETEEGALLGRRVVDVVWGTATLTTKTY